jgi:hypothetical protein
MALGTACSDGDPCTLNDICADGSCISGPLLNCDDGNPCTIDKCDKAMPGGWMQCTHVKDPAKPNCCQVMGGSSSSTNECDDGQPCTWDVCTNWQCEHFVLGDCCKTDVDCDDSKLCTIDKCVKEKPDDVTGKCKHSKISECCQSNADCNDNLYCTTDVCNLAANTCVHKKDDDNIYKPFLRLHDNFPENWKNLP